MCVGRFVTASRAAGLAAICLLLSNSFNLQAQQATALLTGTVKDATGAVVVGAKITLKNSETNVPRSTASSKDGDYLFTLVPIGTYELTVEQQGFDKYVRKGITLQINQNAHLDVVLKVGTTSQVVEVTGDVSQVDTRQRYPGESGNDAAHPRPAVGGARHHATRPAAGRSLRAGPRRRFGQSLLRQRPALGVA